MQECEIMRIINKECESTLTNVTNCQRPSFFNKIANKVRKKYVKGFKIENENEENEYKGKWKSFINLMTFYNNCVSLDCPHQPFGKRCFCKYADHYVYFS